MVMASVVMAFMVMAYMVMAYVLMAYILMASIVMAFIVMASIVMAFIVMAYELEVVGVGIDLAGRTERPASRADVAGREDGYEVGVPAPFVKKIVFFVTMLPPMLARRFDRSHRQALHASAMPTAMPI